MKRSILVFAMAMLLLAGGLKSAHSQEQPKPKKDTVNIDTDAKPTFYYAEDEKTNSKSGIPTVAIIGVAVVVAGAGVFFFMKKKK